jgi:hypothetical protein
MGTCKKFAAKDCGKAYMPCGKDIGEQHSQQWLFGVGVEKTGTAASQM